MVEIRQIHGTVLNKFILSKQQKIVVLYSGGLDSYILYYLAVLKHGINNVHAVYYNHYHDAREGEMQNLPNFVKVVNLDWGNIYDNMYRGKEDDPHNQIYIAGRNLVFTVLAACQELPDQIWIGALSDENHATATDKNEHFRKGTEKLLNYVLAPHLKTDRNIRICMPFVEMNMDKERAIRYAIQEGMTTEEIINTWSCWSAGDVPCGECKQCLKRKIIFNALGFDDRQAKNPLDSPNNQKWLIGRIEEAERTGGNDYRLVTYPVWKNLLKIKGHPFIEKYRGRIMKILQAGIERGWLTPEYKPTLNKPYKYV